MTIFAPKRLFIACLLCAFFAVPSFAADGDIAVVNVDRVMTTAKAAKHIEKQMKKKQEEYQKEFSSHERDLRETEGKLIKEKANFSEEEFLKKRKEFEKKFLDTQKLFQKRRTALTKAYGKASGRLQKEMLQAVADISEKEGFRIVFDRRSLVIVEESLDITDEVIKAVDSKLPEVKLDVKQ